MADEDKPAGDLAAVPAPVDEAPGEQPAGDEAKTRAAAPIMAPAPARARRRAGFVAPLLGGGLAAALGFAVSHFDLFDLRDDRAAYELDQTLQSLDLRITRLDEKTTAANETLVASTNEARSEAGASASAVTGIEEKVTALVVQLGQLDAKVRAQAEALPDGTVPPAAFAALKAEVEALKSAPAGAGADPEALRQQILAELDARAAEVAAAAAEEAEATRQAALRDAALITLHEAVKTGQPYQDALTALGAGEVPAALASHAQTGLPGAAALTEAFPDAARAALEASLRADEGGGFGDRALSLLRIGTGARSLTPQEGNDPDAVLSRAEAAAKAGDLPLALEELKALPPEGLAAMEAWIQQAQSRIDAEAALAALTP